MRLFTNRRSRGARAAKDHHVIDSLRLLSNSSCPIRVSTPLLLLLPFRWRFPIYIHTKIRVECATDRIKDFTIKTFAKPRYGEWNAPFSVSDQSRASRDGLVNRGRFIGQYSIQNNKRIVNVLNRKVCKENGRHSTLSRDHFSFHAKADGISGTWSNHFVSIVSILFRGHWNVKTLVTTLRCSKRFKWFTGNERRGQLLPVRESPHFNQSTAKIWSNSLLFTLSVFNLETGCATNRFPSRPSLALETWLIRLWVV